MEIKKEFLEKVDQTNEQISKSPIVKGLVDGLISLVPFLGSAISSSLDTRAFQLFEENSKRFAEEIRNIVKNLDEAKLDKIFIETPEFTSLLLEVLTRNARAYEEEKVKLFARAFVAFSTTQGAETKYKEGFIKIIDELTVDHIRVLGFVLYRLNNPNKENEKLRRRVLAEDISNSLDIPIDRVLAYCQHLLRFGLLWDWGIGKLGEYKPNKFSITDYGQELATLLKSIDTTKDSS